MTRPDHPQEGITLAMGITASEVFLDQLKDGDVAEVIAFVVSRPRRLAIHEILLRPAGQEL